ncbi:hypothetical protein HDU84_000136 [Entophlyctis sp. JEL0112]|nr:hypothetical protein HDU84_000136 [Entophlyctis sp. JEL0112]
MASATSSSISAAASAHWLQSVESWFGFVKEKADAVALVEAVIARRIRALKMVPATAKLRSGSVIVFAESSLQTQMTRWRDGESWSPSRIQGTFLLYREVESTKIKQLKKNPDSDDKGRFATTSFRPNTRPVSNGFAKRTITVIGSDNNKYRVISYFFPHDVAYLYHETSAFSTPPTDHRRLPDGKILRTPSDCPEFSDLIPQASQDRHHSPEKLASTPLLINRAFNAGSRKRSYESIVSEFCGSPIIQPFEPLSPVDSPIQSLLASKDCVQPHTTCSCGESRALKLKRFESEPFWTERPIILKPLVKFKSA